MKQGLKTGGLLAAALTLLITACENPSGNSGSGASFVAVTGITGVPANGVPETPLTLTGTVTPANATYKTIVWSVKDAGETGAAITNGNTLTATAAGTAIITATIANGLAVGTAYTDDFSITFGPYAAVTGITDVPAAGTVGTPLTLSGTVTPANATYQTIVWSVKDAGTTGAQITGGNTLTATAEGTVVVTATIANGTAMGTAYTDDFNITINSSVPFVAVTGITDVPANGIPGTPLTLTGTVEPANATNKTIVWSVKDAGTTGAQITGNTLTSAAAGTVVVTATIANGTAIGTAGLYPVG